MGVKKDNLREWGILEEWRAYQEDKRGWLEQVKKLYQTLVTQSSPRCEGGLHKGTKYSPI